jgi:hypothetical protein
LSFVQYRYSFKERPETIPSILGNHLEEVSCGDHQEELLVLGTLAGHLLVYQLNNQESRLILNIDARIVAE